EITCLCFHGFIDKDLINLVIPDVRSSNFVRLDHCHQSHFAGRLLRIIIDHRLQIIIDLVTRSSLIVSSGKEESKPRIDKKFSDTIQIDHDDEDGGDDEDDLKHVPSSKRYQVSSEIDSDDDRCLSQVEARLVEFKTQEIKFYEKIKGLEFDVKVKNNKIKNLMNELKKVKKEKDGLDSKLTGFEYASKDLDTLLGSQRSDKNKKGLGYSVVPPSCSTLLSSQKRYVLDMIT
nr:hypothetical protein [Tanacetum cinerariifolium]